MGDGCVGCVTGAVAALPDAELVRWRHPSDFGPHAWAAAAQWVRALAECERPAVSEGAAEGFARSCWFWGAFAGVRPEALLPAALVLGCADDLSVCELALAMGWSAGTVPPGYLDDEFRDRLSVGYGAAPRLRRFLGAWCGVEPSAQVLSALVGLMDALSAFLSQALAPQPRPSGYPF